MNCLEIVSDGEGFCAGDDKQAFSVITDGMKYDVTISRHQNRKLINILWSEDEEEVGDFSGKILRDILFFENLREGFFLEIRRAKLNNKDCMRYVDELIAAYYFRNAGGVNIYSPMNWHLSDAEYENCFGMYEQYLSKYFLQNQVFLYAAFSYGLPVDLRLSLLIEAFEPLYQILINDKGMQEAKADKHTGKISLKLKVSRCIEEYNVKLGMYSFENIDDEVSKCVNTRNMIFHVDRNKKNICNAGEAADYLDKFSILYRMIVMDLIGMRIESNYLGA